MLQGYNGQPLEAILQAQHGEAERILGVYTAIDFNSKIFLRGIRRL
jgi:hypothetical protein